MAKTKKRTYPLELQNFTALQLEPSSAPTPSSSRDGRNVQGVKDEPVEREELLSRLIERIKAI